MSAELIAPPFEDLTVPAVMLTARERFPTKPAFVEKVHRLTYGEVVDEALRVAAAVRVSGVAPGDCVGLWAPNSSRWAIVALGVACAGARLIPINTRFKGREAEDLLHRTRARLVVCADEFIGNRYPEMLVEAAHEAGHDPRPCVVTGGASEGCTGWDAFIESAGSFSGDPVALCRSVRPEHTAAILFTSGTTGRPKGAMLSHSAIVRGYWDWSGVVGLRSDDRYLLAWPFFHASGYMAGFLLAMMRGATVYPLSAFDPALALQMIEQHRISFFPGPPTIFETILNHPRLPEADVSSLRATYTGATVIPPTLITAMRDELGFEEIHTCYGLTEMTGVGTVTRRDDDDATVTTTAGRPLPGVELRIVDADGREVPTGSEGEVCFRGYVQMAGYLDDPDATARAIDAEGWLHTGDIGSCEDAGNVRIVGRLTDMFIVGGFNSYPAEIEFVMTQHPGVSQVAVIGVPDDRLGEVGKAYVVPNESAALTAHDLHTWCRLNMANYKVPRYIELIDSLPTNATGKVPKNVLREMPLGAPVGEQQPAPENP